VPKGKTVVLGLVSTKVGQLESKDDLKRRIDAAARLVPMEQLCLSPQCGFSSTVHGNDIAVESQTNKLKLVVDTARMRRNLDLTHGALFSQRVLLALVASGMERDEAYRIVQEEAQRAWDEGIALRDLLERRMDSIPTHPLDLDVVFDLTAYTRHAPEIVARLDVIPPV